MTQNIRFQMCECVMSTAVHLVIKRVLMVAISVHSIRIIWRLEQVLKQNTYPITGSGESCMQVRLYVSGD